MCSTQSLMSSGPGINFECETSADTMRSIFCELNELRQTGTLCDVKIVVGDSKFPCHRVILSSSCTYFKAMFGNFFEESKKEEVPLQDVETHVFEQILNFIYTGKVRITDANLSSLLMNSEYLGLHHLEDLCLTCIKEHVPMDNVGSLFRFALKTEKVDLIDTLCTYIAANFVDLSKSNELIDLSDDALTRIMMCPDLRCSSSVTNSFLLKWMYERKNHDDSMNSSVEHLLKMITGTNQAQEFIPKPKSFALANLQSNRPLVRLFTSDRRKKLRSYFKEKNYYDYRGGMHGIKPTIKWMSGPSSISDVHDAPITSIKSTVLNEEILFVFYTVNNIIYSFVWAKGSTSSGGTLENMPSNLSLPKNILLAPVQRKIYFYTPDRFIWYDCDRNLWYPREVANMISVDNPSLVSLNDNIYVIGGQRHSESFDPGDETGGLLQHLDVRTGVCNRLPNSLFEHANAAACVYDGKIYVTGGSHVSYYSKVVETFDPAANKWRALAQMPKSKMRHTLVCHNKNLYAIGGMMKEGTTVLCDRDTCVYDVENDTWLETVSMPPRSTDGFKILEILDAVVF